MATTALSASSAPKRVHLGWLFSPGADASMAVLPAAVTVIAVLLAARSGAGAGSERAYAAWLSQFVLATART